jgi:hypothetical protein
VIPFRAGLVGDEPSIDAKKGRRGRGVWDGTSR